MTITKRCVEQRVHGAVKEQVVGLLQVVLYRTPVVVLIVLVPGLIRQHAVFRAVEAYYSKCIQYLHQLLGVALRVRTHKERLDGVAPRATQMHVFLLLPAGQQMVVPTFLHLHQIFVA